MRECLNLSIHPVVDLNKLNSISTIGSNIFSLARQEWLATYSSTNMLTGLINAVNRERALMAAVGAATSMIYIHTTSFASAMFQCEIDVSSSPLMSSLYSIRDISKSVFDLLRDHINHQSSGPKLPDTSTFHSDWEVQQHSPFFGTMQLIVAQGSLLALNNLQSVHISELAQAAMATDFQLAEWAIRKQNWRWPIAKGIADEIHGLGKKIQTNISCPNTRQIAGAYI
jgi:uncharacterized membrane protein YkgB